MLTILKQIWTKYSKNMRTNTQKVGFAYYSNDLRFECEGLKIICSAYTFM